MTKFDSIFSYNNIFNNLAKDGTWKFKAIGFDVDGEIDTFKLGEITGF
jgi:hypothetical protein